MSQPIQFSNEFLPHVIRLFFPSEERINGRVDWFRELLAASGRDLASTTIMLPGEAKLLAFACLRPLECRQPGLVYAHIAIDPEISSEDWNQFWQSCSNLAAELVSAAPSLRVMAPAGARLGSLVQQEGLTPVKELTQFSIQLDTVADLPISPEFRVVSLDSQPKLQETWLQAFNQGLTSLWDQPLWDAALLKRRSAAFPEAWRLGLAGEEPVAALFYEVVDTELSIVKINAAVTPALQRNKGFGRLMLKDVLTCLQGKGYRQAFLLAEGHTQATALLYKLLGFSPQLVYQVWEGPVARTQQEVPAAADEAEAETPLQEEPKQNQNYGFYPMFHSHVSKKKEHSE